MTFFIPAVENYESEVYFVANTHFHQGNIYGGKVIGEGKILGGVDYKREIEPTVGSAVELFNSDPTLKYFTEKDMRKHGFPSFNLLMGDRMPRFVDEHTDETDLWTVMIVGKIAYDSGTLPNFLSQITSEYSIQSVCQRVKWRAESAVRKIHASVGM